MAYVGGESRFVASSQHSAKRFSDPDLLALPGYTTGQVAFTPIYVPMHVLGFLKLITKGHKYLEVTYLDRRMPWLVGHATPAQVTR
ncbi:hypothetical protein SFRURICE_016102, partial [Spodoptera frugiperda]